MSRGPDAGTQLERALVRDAAGAGIALAILAADRTRWASVTFSGARHRLSIAAAPSPRLDAWLAALPEAEFRLRGHLVADVALASERRGELVEIELEALTVEDC
jgi:hypothetical protein